MSDEKTARIARLNDAFRTSFSGGLVVHTAGVDHLGSCERSQVHEAVRAFDAFTADNDPYGEHDFGRVCVAGQQFFFKIDYYGDQTLESGSEDPSDPTQTTRVMTIMLTQEY